MPCCRPMKRSIACVREPISATQLRIPTCWRSLKASPWRLQKSQVRSLAVRPEGPEASPALTLRLRGSKVGFGARRTVCVAQAERRLLVRKGDRPGNAPQRARGAESRPSDRPVLAAFGYRGHSLFIGGQPRVSHSEIDGILL